VGFAASRLVHVGSGAEHVAARASVDQPGPRVGQGGVRETQRHCADASGRDDPTRTGAADVSAGHGRFGTLLDRMDEGQAIYGSEADRQRHSTAA